MPRSPAAAYLPTLFFGLLAICHLWPVWGNAWFVTLDGPCHLANARHLLDLWRGDPFTGTFLHIHHSPVPYWSGQLLMAAFMAVGPARLAEKLIFTLAIGGTGWAFHELMKAVAPARPWAALLGLPFLLHFGIGMGFINFSLSIPLLLLLLHWATTRVQGARTQWWTPVVLFNLLYFTHPSTFLVAVACTGVLLSLGRSNGARSFQPQAWRSWTLAVIPGLLLFAAYIMQGNGSGPQGTSAALSTSLARLLGGRAWNALGVEGEGFWTTLQAVVLLAIGTAALVLAVIRRAWHVLPWGLCATGALMAFFVLPDALAGGSHASGRLLLFAMLLLVLSVATAPLPRWALIAGASLTAAIDLGHTVIQARSHHGLSQEASAMMAAAPALPPRALVLPLNYSSNWMHSNLSSYLAAAHGAVVLDNFVATAPFAPVQWNTGMAPAHTVFDVARQPCVDPKAYETATGQRVTHIMVWKPDPNRADSCTANLTVELHTHWSRIGSSHTEAELYALPSH